jgi:histidinol-phosphate aminotransferase
MPLPAMRTLQLVAQIMKIPVPDYILSLKPYVPGKPLEALEREYGVTDAVKLASNENPLGPSPMAVKALQKSLANLNRYPDGGCYELIRSIADKHGLTPDNIVLGNGSDDVIAMLATALLRPGDEVILPQPSFLFYEIAAVGAGATPVWVPLKSFAIDLDSMAEKINSLTRMVFLTHPHNPTGAVISKAEFENFVSALPPEVVVVMDEAYIEFVRLTERLSCIDYIGSNRMIVGMRTFSKAYGLAGLRVGYGLMAPSLAEILNRVRQPFNVNTLAQVAAAAALQDEDFLHKTIALVHEELDFMYAALDKLGIDYLKSQANFFLVNVGNSADDIFNQLLTQGIIVRSMSSYGYKSYIRVNVGKHAENVRFLRALERILC